VVDSIIAKNQQISPHKEPESKVRSRKREKKKDKEGGKESSKVILRLRKENEELKRQLIDREQTIMRMKSQAILNSSSKTEDGQTDDPKPLEETKALPPPIAGGALPRPASPPKPPIVEEDSSAAAEVAKKKDSKSRPDSEGDTDKKGNEEEVNKSQFLVGTRNQQQPHQQQQQQQQQQSPVRRRPPALVIENYHGDSGNNNEFQDVRQVCNLLDGTKTLWRVPFNGKGAAQKRLVYLGLEDGRSHSPGGYKRCVQFVRMTDLLNGPGIVGQGRQQYYLRNPVVLCWRDPSPSSGAKVRRGEDKAAEAGAGAERELTLSSEAVVVLGHSTSAYQKLVQRSNSSGGDGGSSSTQVPRPELCFSLVTKTRTLDLAAASRAEAEAWVAALQQVLRLLRHWGDHGSNPARRGYPDEYNPINSNNPHQQQQQQQQQYQYQHQHQYYNNSNSNNPFNSPVRYPNSPHAGVYQSPPSPFGQFVASPPPSPMYSGGGGIVGAGGSGSGNGPPSPFSGGMVATVPPPMALGAIHSNNSSNNTVLPGSPAGGMNNSNSRQRPFFPDDNSNSNSSMRPNKNNNETPPPTNAALAAASSSSTEPKKSWRERLFSASYAGDVELLGAVLDGGAPVDTPLKSDVPASDTPLLICARLGHINCLKKCLDHGARNDPHQEGNTALHCAVGNCQYEAAEVLLQIAAKSAANANAVICTLPDADGLTPLHLAARMGDLRMMELLLHHGAAPSQRAAGAPSTATASAAAAATKGYTALHFAVAGSHDGAVEVLLDYDDDLEAIDIVDGTSLHVRVFFSF
jgi:hypothetical protein